MTIFFTPTTPTRLNCSVELSGVGVEGVNWPLGVQFYRMLPA